MMTQYWHIFIVLMVFGRLVLAGPPAEGSDCPHHFKLISAKGHVYAINGIGSESHPLFANQGNSFDIIDPLRAENVGIVGAGRRGIHLAAVHINKKTHISLTEAHPALLQDVHDAVSFERERLLGYAEPGLDGSSRFYLRASPFNSEVSRSDIVIEAVTDSLPIKHHLYREIGPLLSDRTILLGMTANFSIAQLTKGLERPSHFCAIHFPFSSSNQPLVEIISGPKTNHTTMVIAIAHFKALGFVPIVAHDSPVISQLLLGYLNEARQLLTEGVSSAHIDKAMLSFGMAKGPFALIKEVVEDTEFIEADFMSGITIPNSPPSLSRPHLKTIQNRLLSRVVLEASHLLEAQRVPNRRAIDVFATHGIGFPSEKGSLLQWADETGLKPLIKILKTQSKTRGKALQPTELLNELVKNGQGFYQ